tara:strand:+ start:589 stop:1038 length:450 start_codon:yes stop_codon:yes gene_type:complete
LKLQVKGFKIMTDVSTALIELNIKEWILRGEPTSEAEFKRMFRKVTGVDSSGSAIESDKTSEFGVTWKQVSDKKKALEEAEPMKLLRRERDKLLAETDWWASSDLTITTAQKKYRQDLRDITKTANPKIIGDGPRTSLDMSSVTWPTKP